MSILFEGAELKTFRKSDLVKKYSDTYNAAFAMSQKGDMSGALRKYKECKPILNKMLQEANKINNEKDKKKAITFHNLLVGVVDDTLKGIENKMNKSSKESTMLEDACANFLKENYGDIISEKDYLITITEVTKESFEEDNDENVVEEGSYSIATKFGKSDIAKQYDTHLKNGKVFKKEENYKKAIEEFKKCKSLLPKIKDEVNKTIPDDTQFDKFIGFISTAGVNLTTRYKDDTTGRTAYYRKWWLNFLVGAETYLNNQINELKNK